MRDLSLDVQTVKLWLDNLASPSCSHLREKLDKKMENVIAKLYKLAEGSQDLLAPEFI